MANLSFSLPPSTVWRARARFLLYALMLVTPRFSIMVVITLVGGGVLQHRLASGGSKIEFLPACYEVYTQLFFEHASALPEDGVLRAMYFAVPLVGALVLAEGLFKLGASLLDFQNHREKWMKIMSNTVKDHVVLVGLGHVGFRVLEQLLMRGSAVVVIEQKKDGAFVEEVRARGIPLLIGDARRESLLQDAGVARARSLIACTDDDLANLEMALDARQLNPNVRIVMRMFDQSMAQKLGQAFDLDNIFSTSTISAPQFAAAALDQSVIGAYRMGESMMVTIRVPVSDENKLDRCSVQTISERLQCPVVGIHRIGRSATHRFVSTETLRSGDFVLCHVPSEDIPRIQTFFVGAGSEPTASSSSP